MNLKRIVLFAIFVVIAYTTRPHIEEVADLRRLGLHDDSQKSEWILNTTFGFPVQVALNSVRTQSGDRTICVFIDNQDFTEGNLRKLFTGLSAQYDGPHQLFITAYSDAEMLQRAINEYLAPIVDYVETPEHERLSKEWAEKYAPLKTGYFRAYYSRANAVEKFCYSPYPEKEEMITVILK